MLSKKLIGFFFPKGNDSPFSWSCWHHYSWGGGEARRREGAHSSSSAKLTMRPEWAEAGRQYLSTGTLKSCKYLILAVLFLFSFFEKPAPDWQSFHLRLICWIIKRNLTLLRGQVVDLQTQPWRLQRNSERTRRSWPNMRLKLKVKLFKAPQMFSCSTTRRDLASNLCLLYCVLCLIWLGVMHPIFFCYPHLSYPTRRKGQTCLCISPTIREGCHCADVADHFLCV